MNLRSFLHGLILSAVAVSLSLAAALWGMHRAYYIAVLIPSFMSVYVLLAWFTYLRRTHFRGLDPKPTSVGTDLPEDKVSGAELIGRRDERGLVPRRPDEKDNRVESFLRNPIPALLWSALQLAVIATVLYSAFGIGTRYHY